MIECRSVKTYVFPFNQVLHDATCRVREVRVSTDNRLDRECFIWAFFYGAVGTTLVSRWHARAMLICPIYDLGYRGLCSRRVDLRVSAGLEFTGWAHPAIFIQDGVAREDTHTSQVVPDLATDDN